MVLTSSIHSNRTLSFGDDDHGDDDHGDDDGGGGLATFVNNFIEMSFIVISPCVTESN